MSCFSACLTAQRVFFLMAGHNSSAGAPVETNVRTVGAVIDAGSSIAPPRIWRYLTRRRSRNARAPDSRGLTAPGRDANTPSSSDERYDPVSGLLLWYSDNIPEPLSSGSVAMRKCGVTQ